MAERLCLKNADMSNVYFTPCLKVENHTGNCEHKLLCYNAGCMCNGLEDKLKAHGLLDEYDRYRKEIAVNRALMSNIERKLEQEHESRLKYFKKVKT